MPQIWNAPSCDQVAQGNAAAIDDLKKYLRNYNYLQVGDKSDTLSTALSSFQKAASIPQTGKYDEETATKMEKPRCGIPDTPGLAESSTGPTKWKKFNLTYRFDTFCEELPHDTVRNTILAAFEKWAAVSPFYFTEATGSDVDIQIGWYRKHHLKACSPFDGPGNVLAHAFYPPPNAGTMAGDVHFDEDEVWSVVKLENVALHEIGHSLGLDHSNVEEAVMYMFANGVTELTTDDIAGIQSIYGKGPPKPQL